MKPAVTIVGRPNVGKSSLFNALTEHRIAIVSDSENTTRDIIEYDVYDSVNQVEYTLADSGGVVIGGDDIILSDVKARVEDAIDASDIILFVLEYDRITDLDTEIAKRLRKSGKTIIVVGNKADNASRALEWQILGSLGMGDVVMTSPSQRRGIDTLRSHIATALITSWYERTLAPSVDTSNVLKLAIIGRPNVGKSSLVNALSETTRSIVKDLPGTTRDAIDTLIQWEGKELCLIDTAWIRRSWKIGSANIEDWSVQRAERAIERADVVAIVLDAFEGIAHQDLHIASLAIEAKKGIILVVNKWDTVLAKPGIDPSTILDNYMKYMGKQFDFLSYVPVVFTQAIDGKRIDRVLEYAFSIHAERDKRVKTWPFNQFLSQITYEHAPTGSRKSHKPKIYYGSQVGTRPPRFVLSVNNASHFHFSYVRYIENKIREFFGFEGTPIDIELKSRKSIYKTENRYGHQEEASEEKKYSDTTEKPFRFQKRKPSPRKQRR